MAIAGGGLNDLIFFQRMYSAGAGKCFDVAAAQGYGLFSGPWDRRTEPAANQCGAACADARHHGAQWRCQRKPIWLSRGELECAAAQRQTRLADYGRYGISTLDEQARYVPQALRPGQARVALGGRNCACGSSSDAQRRREEHRRRITFAWSSQTLRRCPLYDAMREYTQKQR